jgi:Protein of unknown function (DUF4238)
MDEAVAALLESARKNEKSAPRKHHLIPASYLARWASDGHIRVTDTGSRHTYRPSPEGAARGTAFYSLASDDLDRHEIPALLFETILSQVEGAAKTIIDLLLDRGPTALTVEDVLGFGQFLAFQVTRGRAFRHQLKAVSNAGMLAMWSGIRHEGIAARLREQGTPRSSRNASRL